MGSSRSNSWTRVIARCAQASGLISNNRISKVLEWIRLVGRDSNEHLLATLDSGSDAPREQQHYQWVRLPVSSIPAQQRVLVAHHFCGSSHPVVADQAFDARVTADSFRLKRPAGRQEFDLPVIQGEPDSDLLQLTGSRV